MDYIAGEGVKLWFSRTPDMPTNTSVATDTIPQSVVDKRGKDFATDITSFFRKQFDVAAPMWNSPIQDFGNDQIGRAAEQILSKAASVKDALTEAQKTCQAELDKTLKS
jgi:ABC-type glycerol-3-phosphate transport system substrate-binding protein